MKSKVKVDMIQLGVPDSEYIISDELRRWLDQHPRARNVSHSPARISGSLTTALLITYEEDDAATRRVRAPKPRRDLEARVHGLEGKQRPMRRQLPSGIFGFGSEAEVRKALEGGNFRATEAVKGKKGH